MSDKIDLNNFSPGYRFLYVCEQLGIKSLDIEENEETGHICKCGFRVEYIGICNCPCHEYKVNDNV